MVTLQNIFLLNIVPDCREEDASVEGEYLVSAAEEVWIGGGALLELGAHVGEGLVHPGGHLAGLGDDGAADVGGRHEDDALVGEAQTRGPGVSKLTTCDLRLVT